MDCLDKLAGRPEIEQRAPAPWPERMEIDQRKTRQTKTDKDRQRQIKTDKEVLILALFRK